MASDNVILTINRWQEEYYACFVKVQADGNDGSHRAVLVFNYDEGDLELARKIARLMGDNVTEVDERVDGRCDCAYEESEPTASTL